MPHQTRGDLADIALGNFVVNCIGLPGYYIGLALLSRAGRKNLQLVGFILVSVVWVAPSSGCSSSGFPSRPPSLHSNRRSLSFFVMAGWLVQLEDKAVPAFVILYGLSYLFSNAGPNLATFVIPAEAYPTVRRGSSPVDPALRPHSS